MLFNLTSNNPHSKSRIIKSIHVGYLRAIFVCILILTFSLPGQAVKADSSPLVNMNAGLNDAWFNPKTNGQGFFITVFPDRGIMGVSWFTYDTEFPAQDLNAQLGDPGHRWLNAWGPFDGNTAILTVFVTRGGLFDSSPPVPETDQDGDGTIVLEFSNCNEGLLNYEITSLGISGEVPIQRIATDNIALCESLVAAEPQQCTRAAPDLSHGPNNPTISFYDFLDNNGAIIAPNEILDGGPGPDGIPPIGSPKFNKNIGLNHLLSADLVVGVKVGNETRAYPHNILNWHEIVNDQFLINSAATIATLSYCPLTGSAVLWKSFMESSNKTFGTSGLLFNSNLILYDRESMTLWSQMMEQAVVGEQVTRIPDRMQVVETSWATWYAMYPETSVLSENTGFSRNYKVYPYGSYRESENLLFPVNNSSDNRLHRKERVLGINVGRKSKVYPINKFTSLIETINETVEGMQVVVVGSSALNFAVIYNRELEDCTVLDFEPVQNKLPIVMRDNEGNEWDVFGTAVSGARTGQQLQKTNSYVAYWFAWTAFFPGVNINQ